jgi:hypothetical protein
VRVLSFQLHHRCLLVEQLQQIWEVEALEELFLLSMGKYLSMR